MIFDTATIAAVATAHGKGAIALVRVSGADAHNVARKIIIPWPEATRKSQLCTVLSNDGQVIDQAMATIYKAPHSFTGDDMVEISTHGGLVVPAKVLAAFVQAGAREALPGEFTRRAVLNGKIDLVQAEAIGDLIDARSSAQHSVALRQLDGGLSKRIAELRDKVLEVEALIAYDIDFPEEDDGPIDRSRITAATTNLIQSLEDLLSTAPRGELLREGAMVVIAGPPNVGKSSLFNALIGRARAIVTEIPGTTRDAIEAVIDGEKWPLRLVDTAGLRDTTDIVERLGIEASERYLKEAHVVLACGDNEESLNALIQSCKSITDKPVIVVYTKSDLQSFKSLPSPSHLTHTHVSVSAETGHGLGELLGAIESAITKCYSNDVASPDIPMLTRVRHETAIKNALGEVKSFESSWNSGALPASVAAVHLRAASGHMEELIGAIGVEDVLGKVFSSFCVGK